MQPSTPAWASLFIEWINPASVIFALVFPLIRSIILRRRGLPFTTQAIIESVSSGLSFPSFIALALSGMSHSLVSKVDASTLTLAGAIGLVYTIGGIIRTEKEEGARKRRKPLKP